MAVTYGFFNSLDGDRKYNADQMSEYFKGLVSDGVYANVGNALQVLAGDDMQVKVQPGRMIIDYKWIDVDAVIDLTITAAHVIFNRWTAIVARLDRTNRLIEITTVDGVASSNPQQPKMQNDGVVTEKCLAMIYVKASATKITQTDITDMRPSELCGWVTGLIKQVDTSQLFLQYHEAYQSFLEQMTSGFENWFDNLASKLNVNTYIREYKKRIILDGITREIKLDMNGYEYESSDIFLIHINGLWASEDVVCRFDETSNQMFIKPPTTVKDTVVDILVLKSKIGFNGDGAMRILDEEGY